MTLKTAATPGDVSTTPTNATPAPAPAADPAPAGTSSAPAGTEAAPAVDPTGLPTDDTAPSDPVATPAPTSKVQVIPTAAMKQLKAEERERGRAQALAQQEEEAIAAGFSSHAEMLEFARNQRANPAPAAVEQPPATDVPVADPAGGDQQVSVMEHPEVKALVSELRQTNEKLLEEKRKLNRARAREEKRNRQLTRQLQDLEATSELKMAAQQAGVQDVDYAVECFRRSIKGMSEDDLKTVDEKTFFGQTLRQTHPHLYGTEERPVNTGAPNAATKSKPAGANSAKPEGDANGKVDAMKLSPAEYQRRLRERGLQDPSSGGMLA